jgi:hypothetical protein
MKKILLLMTLMFGFCSGILAQSQMQDVVHFKNDSIIKVNQTDAEQQTAKKQKTKGIRLFTDLGYTFGTKKIVGGGGRVEFTPGIKYQVNPYFSIGAGLGLHYYIDAGKRASTTSPLVWSPFADISSNLTNGFITPFFGLKAGYTFSIKGLYLASSVGLKFRTNAHTAMSLSVGYTYQGAETVGIYVDKNNNVGTADVRNRNIGGISIRIGFEGW